jgi:23S rRNA (cytosine1962-C5)-methyltransferase
MPSLLVAPAEKPIHLVLGKDRVRTLKRGHPWVYRDALDSLPPARSGAMALLKDRSGEILAKGFYDPASALAFRVCALQERLDTTLVEQRLARALHLRQRLQFGAPPSPRDGRRITGREPTTGYRLLNGEGDGLPGLVCDVYGNTAVLKLDGDGPEGFYDPEGVAR